MTNATVGVIAEDATDCETIKVLIQRIIPSYHPKVKGRHANGGGNIFRKGAQWAAELAQSGCTSLILIKDLDRSASLGLNCEDELLNKLKKLQLPNCARVHYCIPVEEIEAWFWADQNIIDGITGTGKALAHNRPESIRSPKEALIRISRHGNQNARYSTATNPRLAHSLDLEICAKRCPSFKSFRSFVISTCSQ